MKRPKGAKGIERKDFMWREDAFSIIDEAEKIDAEFAVYLLSLLYTGIRKSEGLRFLSQDMRPDTAWLRDSKNGDPLMHKLREELADRIHGLMEAHPGRERVFRFKDGGGYFKHLLLRVTIAGCGLECPVRRVKGRKKPEFRLDFVGFHGFRHTWATWMRMFGGADLQGLVGTKNWENIRSVER